MNYYKAMQRIDGRWDYTCTHDSVTFPVGYCLEWHEPKDDFIIWPERDKRLMYENKPKFHTNGHETSKEASECYKNYQLDFNLRLDGITHKTKHQCEIPECNEWTQKTASVGAFNNWHLCDKHLNRQTIEQLFSVGESWSS